MGIGFPADGSQEGNESTVGEARCDADGPEKEVRTTFGLTHGERQKYEPRTYHFDAGAF